MEMHTTPIDGTLMENFKALSRFTQILDSVFPSGVFVHSFGLEPHIVLQRVYDEKTLKTFLENLIIDQYQKMDFCAVNLAYKYLKNNKLNLLVKEDERYSCMLSFEYAKASKDLGENYLKQLDFNIKKPIVNRYFNLIKEKKCFGNEIFILSAYAYEVDLQKELFLLFWCKKNLINIASCALKISKIKPSQIQKILFEFDEKIDKLIKNNTKRFNNFNPLFEEVILSHLNLEPKMFTT